MTSICLNSSRLSGEGWSFGRFIDEIGERYAEIEAIIASDQVAGTELRRWTYAELAGEVKALQWALIDKGIKPGDRVGVMLSSFPEWILYLFAITRLGAIFVPINPRFKASELRYVMRHSNAAALIAMGTYLGHDYRSLIREACGTVAGAGYSELPTLRTVIGVHAEELGDDAFETNELLEWGRQHAAEHGEPPYAEEANDVAMLFYTSGTTSFPKAVPLTHANLLPHSIRAGHLLELQPGEKALTLYPFFGISGGANKVLSTLGCGACLVFQDSFRPEEACELMHREGCTVIHGVDVHIRELMQANRRLYPADTQERRATVAFTAGVDEALARDMGPGLGLYRFIHAYGMTETNPMILRNSLDDPFDVAVKAGGRPADGVEVRIVDPETGTDRETNEEGEIVVRGPTVMSGYLNDSQASGSAFLEDWFRTGDIGVATQEGNIYYVGRLKDMLKVGGFNVAPQEVESTLRTHELVDDVAVTAGHDARLGEVPVAFIKLRPDAQTSPGEIIEWCRSRIANFKVPRKVYIVDSLPYHVAANGSKLQRHVLRDWARQRELDTTPFDLQQ